MQKTKAIELLGGTISAAAEAVGISYQAVDKWPDELPERIADRVLAVQARKHLPPELIGAEIHGITVAPAQPERRKFDLEAEQVEGMQLVDRRAKPELVTDKQEA